MNIQLFGKKKCFETAKAQRYFKERGIKYQEIDIHKYGLSKGELTSVIACIGIENIVDTSAKEYKILNLANIRSASIKAEILQNNPRLFKTPIVRNGKMATVGYHPDVWQLWE